MNLINEMLKNLNVNYIVTDKKGNVISSTVEDEKLVFNVINGCIKENNIFKYRDKFYQKGIISDDTRDMYYIQDVTELEKNYSKLRKDSLTKLYIRGIAMPLIDDYIVQSFEKKESFSIVMGDIDFFKNINDQYGHDVGDKVLKNIALTLLNNFRTRNDYNFDENSDRRSNHQEFLVDHNTPKDILCRYGGEEFLIVVKNASLEETLRRVESVREDIENDKKVTMSFGVFNFNSNVLTDNIDLNDVEQIRDKFIKMADECLYYSKRNGRNRVSYFDVNLNEIKTYEKSLRK